MRANNPFEAAVAIERVAPGRYAGSVDEAWGVPVAPNGGILAAILVRAAEAELGSQAPPVRTVAVQYLDAPEHGAVEVTVEVLRSGRRVSACEVRLRQRGRVFLHASIVCSAAREEMLPADRRAPAAPEFESVEPVDLASVSGIPPMFRRLEYRPTFGTGIFSGAAEALTGGWLSLHEDGAPLDAARLCALVDLWWPAVYDRLRGPAGAPTLQLTVYLRDTAGGVYGPVLTRVQTRSTDEGHLEENVELWSSDGRLLAESLQLALLLGLE